MLRNIWKSKVLRKETKLRIFRSNVKSVLLYGSESWKLNESAKNRLQVFINKCLRQILGIRWFDLVTTEDLLTRTNEQRVVEQILCRRWRWIGHTLRRPDSNIAKRALRWNPQGQRKRGRPRNTWRREVESDASKLGKSWSQIERDSQDRVLWRSVVDGLCSLVG